MDIQIGNPEKIVASDRYIQFSRSNAIRDAFDALVEIITNSDDSYHRLYMKQKRSEDGGNILIEITEQRKGALSIIVVRDRAEGMTLDTMRIKFKTIGERTSDESDRGFMGRGLKDCAELGDIIIESIHEDKYYGCQITQHLEFFPFSIKESGKKLHLEMRKKLQIERGNGTIITLKINPNHSIPRLETIIRYLKFHYALRDILSKEASTRVLIKGKEEKIQQIQYLPPEGNLVIDKKIEVPGYPNAKFTFKLWKAPEILDDSKGDKFRKSGIIIKGERAIHECCLLYSGFERDELARKYYGKIECPHIDTLLKEYDDRRKNKIPHPPENPSLLVDPNRQDGMLKNHPFTIALFQIPGEILRGLIEQDKKERITLKHEIANQETEQRLSALAKAAGKFLSEQVEDINEVTTDPPEGDLIKKGALVYPTYFNIALNEIRMLTFYVSKKIIQKNPITKVNIWSDDKDSLSVFDRECVLRQHSKKEDQLLCAFRVLGKKIKSKVIVKVKCSDAYAEAYAKVIEKKIDEHIFTLPFEFEHKEYSIKEGNKRNLKIFAKNPEVISADTIIQVSSSDSESLPILGNCIMHPISNSNYAVGEVTIQARRLKKDSIAVIAKLDELEAKTKVKIVQEKGSDIKIKIVDEDFGSSRSMWATDENQPNVLKISGKHESIKRYLGSAPKFEGQNLPHFRLLLAEIVAESVTRKSLGLEAQTKPWEFELAKWIDDAKIVDDVIARLQKRMKDFVSIAHQIMLKDSEIPK